MASCATTEMSNSGFAMIGPMHEDTHTCPYFPELGNFDALVLPIVSQSFVCHRSSIQSDML